MENKNPVKIIKERKAMKLRIKRKTLVLLCIIMSLLIVGIIVGIVIHSNSVENDNTTEEVMEIQTIDLKGKKAKDFIWEDYNKLTEEEKAVFPDYFKSMDDYYKWYEKEEPKVQEIEDAFSLDLKGKKAEDFTWEDYNELTEEEKAMFPDYFKSYDEYKVWYKNNKPSK